VDSPLLQTQLTITKADFVAQAKEGATETSTSSTSATQTAKPTNSDSDGSDDDSGDSGGLTTAEIAGIAVVGAVVAASLAAGLFVLFRRRRVRHASREEAHPMLGQIPGPGSGSNIMHAPGAAAAAVPAMTGPHPTTPYASSPNTLSELPTAEMGMAGATLSPASAAAWPAKGDPTKQQHPYSPGSTPSPNGAYTPSTMTAGSWVSPPPPGYSYPTTGGQQQPGAVYEMPNTPAQAHDAAAAAAAPAPVEMDATQTAYPGGGTAWER
jgi:hypothetical protein